jgi:RNA polymerase sigma factor (TIGR02999 family)
MDDEGKQQVTELLEAWSQGDEQALKDLTPLVYKELHRLARRHMAQERANHPLQTTALINEAYIRLIGWKNARSNDRAHFFAIASQVMRRILVDLARAQRQGKRGGKLAQTTLHEECVFQPEKSQDLVLLDEALTTLTEMDPRKGRIVELRFFGGLSVAEIALLLQISDRTVLREWNSARAWLFREVSRKDTSR